MHFEGFRRLSNGDKKKTKSRKEVKKWKLESKEQKKKKGTQ